MRLYLSAIGKTLTKAFDSGVLLFWFAVIILVSLLFVLGGALWLIS